MPRTGAVQDGISSLWTTRFSAFEFHAEAAVHDREVLAQAAVGNPLETLEEVSCGSGIATWCDCTVYPSLFIFLHS